MSRNLTANMVTEVTADSLRPILLAKAEFDSSDLNLWSGIGDLDYNGDTYTGAGYLLSFTQVTETQEIEAKGIAAELSGVPSSIISLALSEEYQERPITIWFAALNSSGALIADPYKLFSGRMDVMEIQESAETATIIVKAESNLIALKRAKERRYTKDDQQLDSPSDTFFDYVPELQDLEINWGRS